MCMYNTPEGVDRVHMYNTPAARTRLTSSCNSSASSGLSTAPGWLDAGTIRSQCGLQSDVPGDTEATPQDLCDWWSRESWYYILPNRIYFFLGSQVSDSVGEEEWDRLLVEVCRCMAKRYANPLAASRRTVEEEEIDECLVVEVYFVAGQEIDSRTGLPWGETQASFDARNAACQQKRRYVRCHECEQSLAIFSGFCAECHGRRCQMLSSSDERRVIYNNAGSIVSPIGLPSLRTTLLVYDLLRMSQWGVLEDDGTWRKNSAGVILSFRAPDHIVFSERLGPSARPLIASLNSPIGLYGGVLSAVYDDPEPDDTEPDDTEPAAARLAAAAARLAAEERPPNVNVNDICTPPSSRSSSSGRSV